MVPLSLPGISIFCSERFALFNIFHKVHLVRERLGTFAYWSYIKMVLRRTRYLKINFLANRQPNFSLKTNSLRLKLNEGWKKPIYTKIQYKSFIVFHLMLLNTPASPFCTTRKNSSHSTHKFDPFRDSIKERDKCVTSVAKGKRWLISFVTCSEAQLYWSFFTN